MFASASVSYVCVFTSTSVSFLLGDMGWSVIMSLCVFTRASVSFRLCDMGWSVIMCVCVCLPVLWCLFLLVTWVGL